MIPSNLPDGMRLSVMPLTEDKNTPPRYFSTSPYEYFSISLNEGDVFQHADLDGYVLFFYSAIGNGTLHVDGADKSINEGGSALVENNLSVRAVGGGGNVLIAGSKRDVKRPDSVLLTESGKHYKVNKPWGHELWFNSDDPDFCFKEVFISAGNRTSLQYHQFKSETILLVRGTSDVEYQAHPDVLIDDVTSKHLGTYRATPITNIDITPNTLHRVSAVTDVLLYEVSTPHFDDVIRIHDDSNRQHGRITTEHKNS